MQDEEWRQVVGYPDYMVSSSGRIVSYKKPNRPWVLAGSSNGKWGYRIVDLSRDGQSKTVTWHSVVAAAFIGPRPPGAHIRHLDGDKTNNAASNLRYGSQSENEQDKIRLGTHYQVLKTHCPSGHEYTAENVYRSPSTPNKRVCRACSRERKRLQDRDRRHVRLTA